MATPDLRQIAIQSVIVILSLLSPCQSEQADGNATDTVGCANCGCSPTDFATQGHDFGRTGHSGTSLGDAWNDLTLAWSYESPNVTALLPSQSVDRVGHTTPIVYGEYVIACFGDSYRILSLSTGEVLKTFSGSDAPYHIAPGDIESTPSVATVGYGDTAKLVLYLAGGSTESITAIDLKSPTFDTLWTLHPGNCVAKGYTGSIGATTFSSITFAYAGGNYLVYFNTLNGDVYAANAATGDRVWGPVVLDGPSYGAMATDGASLYVATAAVPPSNPEGDIYALNLETGTIVWQLSTAGGLRGNSTVYPGKYPNESFVSGLATYFGELYAVSTTSCGVAWDVIYPADGVFYQLNGFNGAVKYAKPAQHVSNANGPERQAGPLIEESLTILAEGTRWWAPPLGQDILAFNRFSGDLTWLGEGGANATLNQYRADGLITCENSGQPGTAVLFDDHGYLSFFKTSTGEEYFSRRIDYTGESGFGSLNNRGGGVALAKSGQLIVSTYLGGIYCLTSQSYRPRLEILDFQEVVSTYGSNPSTLFSFEKMFTNTGFGTLSGVLRFSATPSDVLPGLSRQSVAIPVDQGEAEFAGGSDKLSRMPFSSDQSMVKNAGERMLQNQSAGQPPDWLVSPSTVPFILASQDTADIEIVVDQTRLPRGPQRLYVTFESNDPDYFLNDPDLMPELVLTVNGDCGIDTTYLNFGPSAQNLQVVANTGRFGSMAWSSPYGGPGNFVFDGSRSVLFQGTYLYGVSRRRLALNMPDWWVGSGEESEWKSLLGDLNPATVDCKPALAAGISLGQATLDGFTYVPLTGNMVIRSFCDSVQMFDASGVWNWLDFDHAYYSQDSTIGLAVESRVIGIQNAPPGFELLNNVTVDMMEIRARNGQPVPGFKFGAGIDYDITLMDTAAINREISTAWFHSLQNLSQGAAVGLIKIPFGGCAGAMEEPLKSVRALDRNMSFISLFGIGSPMLDSAYYWMSQAPGAYSQGSMHNTNDQGLFATLLEQNIPPTGGIKFAVAHFGFKDISSPGNGENYRGLATLVNKWMGFGRGDVNNDGVVNLADIIYLSDYVYGGAGTPGPIPFEHLGDVNADGALTQEDIIYLVNYYFHYEPCPQGKFIQF
ncbi:MAG: PQQ-binding-like beta-propeller repeat protein [bacterium]|nr:PQQ-binding-like beta-propeller repeat protein [bacterium]